MTKILSSALYGKHGIPYPMLRLVSCCDKRFSRFLMLASFANGQWLICSSRSVVGIVAVIKKLLLIPPASENFSICGGQRNSTLPRSKTDERGNLSVRRLGRSWICVKRASREID